MSELKTDPEKVVRDLKTLAVDMGLRWERRYVEAAIARIADLESQQQPAAIDREAMGRASYEAYVAAYPNPGEWKPWEELQPLARELPCVAAQAVIAAYLKARPRSVDLASIISDLREVIFTLDCDFKEETAAKLSGIIDRLRSGVSEKARMRERPAALLAIRKLGVTSVHAFESLAELEAFDLENQPVCATQVTCDEWHYHPAKARPADGKTEKG